MVAAGLAVCGCGPDTKVLEYVRQGEYGEGRAYVAENMTDKKSDRNYMLDRMALGIVTLADGMPDAATPTVDQIYETLRTQGVNADRTVAAVAITEGVRFWKGEPFEQAMAYYYIALYYGMRSEWDNMRAAADGSLFLLRDFGENAQGKPKTQEDIAEAAAKAEKENKDADYIDTAYVAKPSNFALGYLLKGIAAVQLAREDEAQENLATAAKLNASLQPLVSDILGEKHNTLLVVDYGLGPEKEAYGMDKVYTRFTPREGWAAANPALQVDVAGGASVSVGAACNLNLMAADQIWRNLEDVRVAKSLIGTGMVAAGGATAVLSRNNTARAIGAGVALAGMAMKASAHADTRYCVVMPALVYVVPVTVPAPGTELKISIGGDPLATTVLPAVGPPTPPEHMQVFFVRLVPNRQSVPAWVRSGQILYANDAYAGSVPGDDLPYILGGRCVRTPTAEALSHYQAAGKLRDLSLEDLRNLYRAEGIGWELDPDTGRSDLHVLEGGTSLVCPDPASIGYLRLFCAEHPPYKPKSDRVRQLRDELAAERGEVALH
ncbi:MAG: hypothetical protein H6816_14735 [Phycisphaerales bacterium]|nr:hypothetical protein [Phycisphaerales bacterium]